MKRLLVAMLTCVLAVAVGASAFVSTTPRQTFMAECVARTFYPTEQDAINGCKEELFELRQNRTFATVFTTAGTLVLVPVIVVNLFALSVWLPVMFRRRR